MNCFWLLSNDPEAGARHDSGFRDFDDTVAALAFFEGFQPLNDIAFFVVFEKGRVDVFDGDWLDFFPLSILRILLAEKVVDLLLNAIGGEAERGELIEIDLNPRLFCLHLTLLCGCFETCL